MATATTSVGKVTSTTDSRFAFDVLRHHGPVLVDFHATWCRTCQLLEPVLDELARSWADEIRIVSVDVERHPGATRRHHVRSIPTLVLFDKGVEQDRLVDVIRRQRIDDWLHEHLGYSSDQSKGHASGDHAFTTTNEHEKMRDTRAVAPPSRRERRASLSSRRDGPTSDTVASPP